MYATLFKPRILVPSFPKLDMHSSIHVSKYPENLTIVSKFVHIIGNFKNPRKYL